MGCKIDYLISSIFFIQCVPLLLNLMAAYSEHIIHVVDFKGYQVKEIIVAELLAFPGLAQEVHARQRMKGII